MGQQKNHNQITHFTVNKVTPVKFCGATIGYQMEVDSSYELPFMTTHTEGDHNYKKCEKCQKTIVTLNERFNERFNGNEEKKPFPYCCELHENLVSHERFNRNDFIDVPVNTANKVVYTNQHFVNNINTDNWYKTITDYIDWTVDSFGQMPKDCGEPLYLGDYLDYITELFKSAKVASVRKKKILAFVYQYRRSKPKTQSDFNILVKTYENWIKLFPWEISFFKELKDFYMKRIPVIQTLPEVNIFSGMAKGKLHSKESLIESLVLLTENITTKVNTLTQYENGLLTDIEKTQIELIVNDRKLKLKKIDLIKSDNADQRYRTILKEWFKDEKQFLMEIKPLLQKKDTTQAKDKPIEKPSFEFADHDSKVFKNLEGFNIFMAFKSEAVKPETELADYSYLFTRLKKDGYVTDVIQKEIIAYLGKYHNSAIESKGHIQFKFSKTPFKERTYNRLKKLYQLD